MTTSSAVGGVPFLRDRRVVSAVDDARWRFGPGAVEGTGEAGAAVDVEAVGSTTGPVERREREGMDVEEGRGVARLGGPPVEGTEG
jgi:hypothetical protein